jgi:Alpha 1,4-glycosyltransferase conserved region/Glycosyltransferase sugar-binding region containing DXD motif
MGKTIIQSLWIGSELSTVEQLCINSYLKNDHEFHLYTYEDIKNIPEGTSIKDAGEIIPSEEIFMYSTGTYAIFSDWFRWKLLYEKGGIWVDTDEICLKPFDFDTDLIFGREKRDSVAIGVLGFPAGHELCAFMQDICENPNKILPYDSTCTKLKKIKRKLLGRGRHNTGWGEAGGPPGFTKALEHFNLIDQAKPFTYFYAIPHYSWDAAFDETFANDVDLFSNSYAVHLWNDMMRHKKGFDKNGTFPKNSLFEQLKTKYL